MSEDPGRTLEALSRMLGEPEAPISNASRAEIETVHLADSLAGLEFEQLKAAGRVADIGSGAGLPGLPLAAHLPDSRWHLIESTGKKARFIERAVEEMGLENVEVHAVRTEELAASPSTREQFDLVTARAVGPLGTTVELASPLLGEGGHLMVWRGARDPEAEGALETIGEEYFAMGTVEVRPVSPYPGSRERHIHLLRKNGPTPEGLPRRPGLAAKRPFGTE